MIRYLLQVIRSRWRLFSSVTVLVFILAGLKAFIQPKTYQATLTLLLEPDFISVPTTDLPIGGGAERPYIPPEFRDNQTIIEIIKSREILEPVISEIASNYPDEDYLGLSSKLTVRHISGSELIEITFRDTDPEKIRVILDELSNAYIAYAQEASLKGINQAFKLVEEQLPLAQERVDNLQQELQVFRQTNGFYSPEQQSENLYEQFNSLISQSRDLDISLNATAALFQELQDRVTTAPNLEDASSAALYLSILNSLESDTSENSSLARQALGELGVVGELAPSEIVKLDNALKLLDTRNNIVAITEQKIALEQEIQGLRENVNEFALLDRRYADIKRELDISVASLNRLLATEEELRIEISRQVPPWEIITDEDTRVTPVTSTPRVLFLGLLAAFFTGTGITLIVNQIDNKYMSLEDIQSNSKYPILGIIPFQENQEHGKPDELLPETINLKADFSFHEAFELLNVNLRLLDPDQNISSFVISSATPREGKSTVAQFLAKSIHQSGKNVLLVDADLRRPSLSSEVSSELCSRGLSDLIIGDREDCFSFINKIPNDADILLSGQSPPDSVKLFSSKRFETVFSELKQHYDVIIFDAPPALGLGDARLLSHKTDGMILIINTDTHRQTIKRLYQELAQSNTSVIGVVVNNSLNKANFHDHVDMVHEYYKCSR